jgi:hypothetical protein
VCGLPPLSDTLKLKTDFSGDWSFNEDKSVLDSRGAGNLPSSMQITQSENSLTIQKTIIQEYTDDKVTVDHLTLDGKENKSELFNAPDIITANWSSKFDTLLVLSKASLKFGGRAVDMNIDEKWTLQDHGKVLSIIQSSNSPWGKRNIILAFDKK